MRAGKLLKYLIVLLPSAAAAVYLAWPGRLPVPDRVILVTIDTLRADHLRCYGYPRDTSPFIDRLAAQGILFLNAFSSSSHTNPSHASIFSSLHPVQHRAIVNGEDVSPSVLTAAEIFKESGYDTAGFFSVRYLRELGQGFDTLDGDKYRSRDCVYRQADKTSAAVLDWLEDKKPSDRFFLWIHFFDPHQPYQPPEEYLTRMTPFSSAEGAEFSASIIDEHGIPPDFYPDKRGRSLLDIFNPYDAEIAFADRELERIFDRMEEKGLNEKTLWIVTADHGEGLGNHGFPEHSKKIFNEQLHVPLILYFGGGKVAPRRVERMVRHVDILPTMAELINYPLKEKVPRIQGVSLLPFRSGWWRSSPERYSFSQRRPAPRRLRGWEPGEVYCLQDSRFKYIYHSRREDEFYDLASDPFELKNLINSPLESKEKMKDLLDCYYNLLLSQSSPDSGEEGVPPEYIEELKALGYI